MKNVWFISDTHFGHGNILEFKYQDVPLRTFSSVEEMDETIIARWNEVVRPADRVYHLGDVAINRKSISTIARCNGRKVLLRGNHDIFKLKDYTPYFDDIRAYKVYPTHGIICCHIPIHERQLGARFGVNVHGHLHAGYIPDPLLLDQPDPRYLNVSVERTGYRPVSLDEILRSRLTGRTPDFDSGNLCSNRSFGARK